MRILVVSSYLPYPLFSGGHIRLYNILKELSQHHEITLVCEMRGYQTEKDRKEMEKLCKKVITLPRQKQWSFSTLVKSAFALDPFLVVGHTSDEMHEVLREELQEPYDLIHVETFYVMQNLPETDIPIVLVEHNVEYLVYKRYADAAPLPLRPLLYFDVFKMQRLEKSFWKTATTLVAVSEEEKSLMKRNDVVVVPNGVDTERYTVSPTKLIPASEKEKRILFIGDFKWMQNTNTARWILTEIWPIVNESLQKEGRHVKLWMVGRTIPDSLKKLNTFSNVVLDERAPKDTAEIFNRSDILLAPIRVGGGTSFKILEAMASGVAVVTTPLGREGITMKNAQEVAIGTTSEEIAKHVVALVKNDEKRITMVKSARALIEEKYNWKTIVQVLEKAYASVVKQTL